MKPTNLISISKLASSANVSLRTIRYYEEEGLLESSKVVGGKSFYDDDSINELKRILILREAGFAIKEIKLVFKIRKEVAPFPSKGKTKLLRSLVKDTLEKLRQKEDELRKLRLSLESLGNTTASCDSCNAGEKEDNCRNCGKLELLEGIGITKER